MRSWLLIAMVLLTACAAAPAPPPSPASKPSLLSVGELLASTPGSSPVTVVGYLYADPGGVILTDGLSFSADASPQPLQADPAQHIWLGATLDSSGDLALQRSGETRYGIVEAQGQLEGPGGFGPDARYRYQLSTARLTPRAPQELTISTLLSNSDTYTNQVVRVGGDLLTNEGTAILVEAVGRGGVPAPNSLQIKLDTPLRDPDLLQQLSSLPNSSVYFGPVQIDGLWRQGVLRPFAITAIEPHQ